MHVIKLLVIKRMICLLDEKYLLVCALSQIWCGLLSVSTKLGVKCGLVTDEIIKIMAIQD